MAGLHVGDMAYIGISVAWTSDSTLSGFTKHLAVWLTLVLFN